LLLFCQWLYGDLDVSENANALSRAVKEQLIFYAIAGVIGGAFAIYFIVRGGMKT